MAASIDDVTDTLQRTTFGEGSNTKLNTSRHFGYLYGVTSLESCIS